MAGIRTISGNTIRVTGFQNVSRSFSRVSKTAKKNLNVRLKEAIEPVRESAQELGPARIRNLRVGRSRNNIRWDAVRSGVTQRAAYIAPVERGVKSRGNARFRRGTSAGTGPPSFDDLVLDRAYEPALAMNRSEVVERFGRIFDDIQHAWRG